MSGGTDSAATRPVKYGLSADDAARDPFVKRHFAVAEEDAVIHAVVLQHSLDKLAELRRDGLL